MHMSPALGDIEDATLVARAAEGDDVALGVLYDRHVPTMLLTARRMLKDPNEAEDLVHDVFMEAHRKADSYDPSRASVKTWLAVRLRSRALDRLRSARVSRTDSLDAKPAPERFARVSAHLSRMGDQGRLAQVLADLPENQREVLQLAYFEGLSSREVGERLGIPTGTVKSRTRAAFQKLRAVLHSRPMTAMEGDD